METVVVAVGVLVDNEGRVLVSKRAADAHQGGLWEFPGGKVEAAESVDDALRRTQGTSRALITFVTDRPGHDKRYAIDPTRITEELGWQPRHNVEQGLAATVAWYLKHQHWCAKVRAQANYDGGRLGLNRPQ